jgi:organic radical activating enzyme
METLKVKQVALFVTHRCTLKCKLCGNYSPYYIPPPHFSYDYLSKTIRGIFDIFDEIEKFNINGGEPLLHPQLPEIVDFLSLFINKINILEITTNGTIIPSDRLLKNLTFSNKVDILVDNYGPELSTNVNRIDEAFNNFNIRHRIRTYYGANAHCGGWVNLLDLTKKHDTDKDIENIFSKCYINSKLRCMPVIDGKAYVCPTYKRCKDLDLISDNPDEYIDILSENISLGDKKEQARNFYNRKYFTACAYCSGFCADSPRFAPAEQLED